MNFLDCINNAVIDNKLDYRTADEFKKDYQVAMANHLIAGNTGEASAKAAAEIIGGRWKALSQKKQKAYLQKEAIDTLWTDMSAKLKKNEEDWSAIKQNSRIARFLVDAPGSRFLFYKPSISREYQKVLTIADSHARGMESYYRHKIDKMMRRYQRSWESTASGGLIDNKRAQDLKFLDEAWLAAAGKEVADPTAQAAGKELRVVLDELHDIHEASGGVLGKIENYMPQYSDSAAVSAAGFQKWFDDVHMELDWKRIKDSNGAPIASVSDVESGVFTPRMMDFMEAVYETLSTDGINKLKKQGEKGKSKLSLVGGIANRHSHARVMHFKSPDAQLNYNKKYGNPDTFGQILRHITGMSKDISAMRVLGPNPDTSLGNFELRSGNKIDNFTKTMHDTFLGRLAMDGSESEMYKIMRGTQSYLQSTQLGSAFIPALGDSVSVAMASRFSGDSAFKTFKQYFTSRPTKDIEAEMFVNEAALGNMMDDLMSGDSLVGSGSSAGDKFMETGQKLSTWTMRTSLLSGLTQHGKDLVTHGSFTKVAAYRDLNWDELGKTLPDFRKLMEEGAGITARDWDAIRATKPEKFTGNKIEYIAPSKIADRDAAIKFEAYIQYMRALATNEPTLMTKAVTTGGLATNQWPRIAMNMAFMYRAFPITMWNNYIRKMATEAAVASGKGGGGKEFGVLVAYMTALTGAGAATLWAKDLRDGKTPREADSGFFGQAVLQGGALGVFADFVKLDSNRYGDGLAKVATGPMVGFIADTAKVTGDGLNFSWAVMMEDDSDEAYEKYNKTRIDWAKRYIPGSTLWHANALMRYTMGEELDLFLYGDGYYDRKSMELQRMEELGQRYINE